MNDVVVDYYKCNFVFVSSHYDIHLHGTCMHEGKLWEFTTHDNTDYRRMQSACPSCSGNDDADCTCESFSEVVCVLTPLTFLQRLRWKFRQKMFEICVGYHWSYPHRANGVRFINKRPILFALFYWADTKSRIVWQIKKFLDRISE